MPEAASAVARMAPPPKTTPAGRRHTGENAGDAADRESALNGGYHITGLQQRGLWQVTELSALARDNMDVAFLDPRQQ